MLLALVLSGCGSAKPGSDVTPPSPQWLYTEPRAATPTAHGYLLRVEPGFLTSGLTASIAQAQAEGKHCAPVSCPPVDDDYYRIDAGRQLVFRLPASTRGTVLVRTSDGYGPKTIDGRTLATLVGNGKAPGVDLFEPLDSGLWLRVDGDTVGAFRQQYAP